MAFVNFVFLFLSITAIVADLCFKDSEIVTAVSYLRPNSGSSPSTVKGTVKMMQARNGGPTVLKIKINGLENHTAHGFHVHAYGDTVSQGCKSTGGHYNPFKKTHGAPTSKIRHVGDLGNVYSDGQGIVDLIKMDHLVSLVGEYSIIGRAFVLHAKTDDLGKGGDKESTITGNAGKRIACGVIVHSRILDW